MVSNDMYVVMRKLEKAQTLVEEIENEYYRLSNKMIIDGENMTAAEMEQYKVYDHLMRI